MGKFKLFTGNSNPKLAGAVARHLDKKVSEAQVSKFKNSETCVQINESVREYDVFIMQSGCGQVNDMCMELFILINACRTASASRTVAVLPYFPYSKQSKQKKRGAIPAKLVATMLRVAGVTQIITLDLHHMQMQGFFDVPIDNIKSSPLLINCIREKVPNYGSAVVVAKNAGASKRAAVIAKRLHLEFAMIFGEQTKFAENLSEERLDGDGSLDAANDEVKEENVGEDVAAIEADEQSHGNVIIGSVEGKVAILVDDILDASHAFILAADLLKQNGATKIYVVCTHGLLSGDAPEELQASCIDKIFVTNTIPQDEAMKRCPKLECIDCSYVLAETIRRCHNNESMSTIFSVYQ